MGFSLHDAFMCTQLQGPKNSLLINIKLHGILITKYVFYLIKYCFVYMNNLLMNIDN